MRFDAGARAGSFLGYVEKVGNAVNGLLDLPEIVDQRVLLCRSGRAQRDGTGRLRGIVVPRDDAFRIYLMVQKRADGSLGVFIRNPERNIGGANFPVERLEQDGSAVKLIGKARDEAKEKVLLKGSYNADDKTLSLGIADYGGTYDFTRDDDAGSDFYPRGRTPRPLCLPAAVGARATAGRSARWTTRNISRAGMEKFVQMVSTCRWIRRTGRNCRASLSRATASSCSRIFPRRIPRQAPRHALGLEKPDRDDRRRGDAGGCTAEIVVSRPTKS